MKEDYAILDDKGVIYRGKEEAIYNIWEEITIEGPSDILDGVERKGDLLFVQILDTYK